MTPFNEFSVKVANYKCFGPEFAGFDGIKPINIVIGRNNVGKSTLLEIIEFAVTHAVSGERAFARISESKFRAGKNLTEQELKAAFKVNERIELHNFRNNWEFGKQWLGKRVEWTPGSVDAESLIVDPPFDPKVHQVFALPLLQNLSNPFRGRSLKWIAPERAMKPEVATQALDIGPSGSGLTNLIQTVINSSTYDSAIVERKLLDEVNKVLAPDAHLTRIVVQLRADISAWEVYVEEDAKGRVQLSHSGSGIKTIFHVLSLIHVLPYVEKRNLNSYVFAFEELENNLHPSLERRLLLYLANIAETNSLPIFLTTHSGVCIDLFSRSPNAQIVHVTHDGTYAQAKTVKTYFENCGILDDLDVRASDLLQSNVVVWLEGPSDRIYFNRWIDLLTEGTLREGAHYQCVSYGGRLLAHLTAAELKEDATPEFVELLRLNRNAVLLIDSDREVAGDAINATKRRLQKEITESGGHVWVTDGREIENYIPVAALQKLFPGLLLPPMEPFADIADYLESIKAGERNRFERAKVVFAERIAQLIDRAAVQGAPELLKQLTAVIAYIRKCNRLE